MPQSEQEMREHIRTTVTEYISQAEERRQEALREYFLVTMPNLSPQEIDRVAEMVPPLLPELYGKWITMFIDRLFETIPRNQLEELCSGTSKNNAALVLVYIMFMESERMENQIDEDLRQYGISHSGENDMGDAVGNFIRAKMVQLGNRLKKRET